MLLKKRPKYQSGQYVIEYGLLLALLVIVCIAILGIFGDQLKVFYDDIVNSVSGTENAENEGRRDLEDKGEDDLEEMESTGETSIVSKVVSQISFGTFAVIILLTSIFIIVVSIKVAPEFLGLLKRLLNRFLNSL